MSRTASDARQIILRRFLEQIGNRTHHDGTSDAKAAGVSELDNLLDSIDLDLTSPLRLDASNPADLVVSVGPAIVSNTESSRQRSIPHIGSLLPNTFTSGTVTFSTPGGAITISPGNSNTLPAMGSNEYVKVLIYMDALGDLNVLPGVPDATESVATVLPSPRNTLPVGYVTLQENGAGGLNAIAQDKIYQFGTGAGGSGGAGDASSIEETLKNRLLDSPFEAVTPNIFERDEDNLVDVSSTGAYSLVTNDFAFSAGSETMVSVQHLDSEFLAAEESLDDAELMVFWDLANIDTGATYDISRNGGNEWQTVTMERVANTELYRGLHSFADEASNQSLLSQATANLIASQGAELNATDKQEIGQLITLANTSDLRTIELNFAINGAPDGNIFVALYSDSSGDPSGLVAETNAIAISGLSDGLNTITLPKLVKAANTYHMVIRTDQAYKDTFTTTSKSLEIRGNAAGTDGETYNGTTWSAAAFDIYYDIEGIEYDLRVRITASAASNLNGYGIFYDKATANIATGVKEREVFKFLSVTDNDNVFTLTNFIPEPDLLSVYYVEAGQVFKYPAFTVSGQNVVFEVDQFNNGGIEADVTLIFDQTRGGAFDNTDQNATNIASLNSKLLEVYDAIVGSTSEVSAGIATHSSIATAISLVSAGARILVLDGTYTETLTIDKKVFIEGKGHGSYISGNVTFDANADYSMMKWIKFHNLTLNAGADGIYVRECWQTNGSTITDNGSGNSTLVIEE